MKFVVKTKRSNKYLDSNNRFSSLEKAIKFKSLEEAFQQAVVHNRDLSLGLEGVTVLSLSDAKKIDTIHRVMNE